MEGSLVAYKVFTNGSVLNASEINDNLMNQSVMVFSNSTARAAALTAPVEGMLTWLQDTNKYENYNGTAWVALSGSGILQVVSTTKTDTFTMASTTFADVTGLSVTITPSSVSSKIYIMAAIACGATPATVAIQSQLLRNSTSISIGDAAGSRTRTSGNALPQAITDMSFMGINFLDSPATTSATTYKIQVRGNVASTVAVNRSVNDADAATSARTASSITVMEVAG